MISWFGSVHLSPGKRKLPSKIKTGLTRMVAYLHTQIDQLRESTDDTIAQLKREKSGLESNIEKLASWSQSSSSPQEAPYVLGLRCLSIDGYQANTVIQALFQQARLVVEQQKAGIQLRFARYGAKQRTVQFQKGK